MSRQVISRPSRFLPPLRIEILGIALEFYLNQPIPEVKQRMDVSGKFSISVVNAFKRNTYFEPSNSR
jgi:hypothetical protein